MTISSDDTTLFNDFIGNTLRNYWFFNSGRSIPLSIINYLRSNTAFETTTINALISAQKDPTNLQMALVCALLRHDANPTERIPLLNWFLTCNLSVDQKASAALLANKPSLWESIIEHHSSQNNAMTNIEWPLTMNAACSHHTSILTQILAWVDVHSVKRWFDSVYNTKECSVDPFKTAVFFNNPDGLKVLLDKFDIQITHEHSPYETTIRNAIFLSLSLQNINCLDQLRTRYPDLLLLFNLEENKSDLYSRFADIGESGHIASLELLRLWSQQNSAIKEYVDHGLDTLFKAAVEAGEQLLINHLFEVLDSSQIKTMLLYEHEFASFTHAIANNDSPLLEQLVNESSAHLLKQLIAYLEGDEIEEDEIEDNTNGIMRIKRLSMQKNLTKKTQLQAALGRSLSIWFSNQHGPNFYHDFPASVIRLLNSKTTSLNVAQLSSLLTRIPKSYQKAVLTIVLRCLDPSHNLLSQCLELKLPTSLVIQAVLFAKEAAGLQWILQEHPTVIEPGNPTLFYDALTTACLMGKESMITVIDKWSEQFDKQTFLNHIDDEKYPVLNMAACFDRLDVLEWLSTCFNQTDDELNHRILRSALFFAMQRGTAESVRYLISLSKKPVHLLTIPSNQQAACNAAFYALGEHNCSSLLQIFTTPPQTDDALATIFYQNLSHTLNGAVLYGHTALIQELIAICPPKHRETMLAGQDRDCQSFINAIELGHLEILQQLIQASPAELLQRILGYNLPNKKQYDLTDVLMRKYSPHPNVSDALVLALLTTAEAHLKNDIINNTNDRIIQIVCDQLEHLPQQTELNQEQERLYYHILLQGIRLNNQDINDNLRNVFQYPAIKRKAQERLHEGETLAHWIVAYNNTNLLRYLLENDQLFLINVWKSDNNDCWPEDLIPSNNDKRLFIDAFKPLLIEQTKVYCDSAALAEKRAHAERVLRAFFNVWTTLLEMCLLSEINEQIDFVQFVIEKKPSFHSLALDHLNRLSALNGILQVKKSLQANESNAILTLEQLSSLYQLTEQSLPIPKRKWSFFSQPQFPTFLSAIKLLISKIKHKEIDLNEASNLKTDNNDIGKTGTCFLKLMIQDHEPFLMNAPINIRLFVNTLLLFPAMYGSRRNNASTNTPLLELSVKKEQFDNCLQEFKQLANSILNRLSPINQKTLQETLIPGIQDIVANEDLIVDRISAQTADVYFLSGHLPIHTNHYPKGNREASRALLRSLLENLFAATKICYKEGRIQDFFEKLCNGECIESRTRETLLWVNSLTTLASMDDLMGRYLYEELDPFLQVNFKKTLSTDEEDIHYVCDFIYRRHKHESCKKDPHYAPSGQLTREGIKRYLIDVMMFSEQTQPTNDEVQHNGHCRLLRTD